MNPYENTTAPLKLEEALKIADDIAVDANSRGNMAAIDALITLRDGVKAANAQLEALRANLVKVTKERDEARAAFGPVQEERMAISAADVNRGLREELKTANIRIDKLKERRFPGLDGPSIPWSVIAPHEGQAIKNHDQTLERLAERGGLDPVEMVAVLEGKKFPHRFSTSKEQKAQEMARCLAVLAKINADYDAVKQERDNLRTDLTGVLRDARRVLVILERCNAIPNGGEDQGNMLDIMDVRQKIDVALARVKG